VLVIDNASFYHSDQIKTLCAKAESGYCTPYLPPYSRDFNPIEKFFAELNAYIKKASLNTKRIPAKGFMPCFGGVYIKSVRNRTVPTAISDI
jgi:transposase